MLNKLIFYGLLVPFSWLPMFVLYLFAKLFLLFAYNIFGYRKEVVFNNLKNSFPNKSQKDIARIARGFYRHFGQINAEGIKGMSIKKRNLKSRYKVLNPEIMQNLYDEGRSAILVSGHLNNWEFMVQSLGLHFPHNPFGVGKPITNEGIESIFNRARVRFGMTVLDQNNVRQTIEDQLKSNNPFSLMLLADQSPASHKKCYWMRFLNQDTPVIFGPEYLAIKYDLPVIYYEVIKKKVGFYEVNLIPVSYHPTTEAPGDITYNHTKLLETSILKQPESWLWSHKRWKYSHYANEFEVRN